jgi:hypothetical protein
VRAKELMTMKKQSRTAQEALAAGADRPCLPDYDRRKFEECQAKHPASGRKAIVTIK